MNENVIDIEGVIGWEVTARGVKRAIAEMGEVDVINVNINSPGGFIDEGFGIYTALKNHSASVNMHITGMAASMASVIAMAGDNVTIEPTGMFMIHPPSNIVWGTAVDLRKGADVLDKYEKRIVTAYNRRELNLSEDELAEAIAEETWYTADELMETGFIDAISEGSASEGFSEEAAASALAWMKVAAFKNAPEQVAETFGFYKHQDFQNAATKKMVKAIATDGPAVQPTKGNEMTEQVKELSAADIEQAVNDEQERILAMLAHPNGSNTQAVIKIARMNLTAEQSTEMLDLVGESQEKAATVSAEDVKTEALAEVKGMIESVMANSDTNKVNINAGVDDDQDTKKPVNVSELYKRVK